MVKRHSTPSHEYHSGRMGHRHGLMVLAFLGCMFMYATRVGLSVAMVAMTAPAKSSTSSTSKANLTVLEVCPADLPGAAIFISNTTNVTDPKTSRVYDWDSETQGILHGAFFYGYLVSQIPGGWVAHRFGAKLPIAVSISIIGVLTIVSPFAADGGVAVFFFIRLLVGLFQGVVFPSITVLWSEWAPPVERGRLLSVTYSGSQMGTVLGMFLSGFLAQAFGWESIFYCFGALSIVWVIPWMFLAFDSPRKHPTISVQEKDYILTAINPGQQSKEQGPEKKPSVPWMEIFKTVPVLALLIVEFCHNYGFYTLVTNLPTYLNNVLHFSLKSNGALSAMPYLVRWFVTILSVFVGDWIRTRKMCSPTLLHKIFSIGAFVGTGAGLIGVAFAGCDATLAVVLFAVAVGLSGWVYVGYLISYTELSPNFAGVLIGLGNTVGTIAGIVAPYVVGVLTIEGQSVENWRTVFFISAGLYGFIALVYGTFGSSVRQSWDKVR